VGKPILIMMEFTGEGRVCIPVGLTKTYVTWFDKLYRVCLKNRRKKKNSLTGPEPAAI